MLIYILKLRCGTVWLHGWGISVFPIATVLILLSVIIFTGRTFPHPTFTGARGAHKLFISPTPKFVSAIPKNTIRHYSSIIFTCHIFQSSHTPLFSFWCCKIPKKHFFMSHRLAAFRSQCQWTNSYHLPPLWRWELNLDLKGIEGVIINLILRENYSFDNFISDYFYRSPFTTPHLYGC